MITCFVCSIRIGGATKAGAGMGGSSGTIVWDGGCLTVRACTGGSIPLGRRGHGTESGQGTDAGAGILPIVERGPLRKEGRGNSAGEGVIADKGFGTVVERTPFIVGFVGVLSDELRFLGARFEVGMPAGAALNFV
jgi:hypothetical protein